MKFSSILFVVATATAAPLALPEPEPQRGINFGNIAGQLAGNFQNIAGQIAGNLENLAGNFLGNLPRIGDLPSIGDFCFIPIVCDFVKVVQTEEHGTAEEKEAAMKAFEADWEQATPEAKQLFAPVAA
jgi:hypothetical protein